MLLGNNDKGDSMADLLEIFSTNINNLMKSRGENIKELSLSINTPYTTVSNWVHGKKMARAGGLQDLSRHYHVPLSYLTTEHSKELNNEKSHEYNYFDTSLSAGMLTTVDPFTSENVKKITLSDCIMGKYAGNDRIFITYINGESMNRIMPNRSLIAIKKYDSISDLNDGDIVAFSDADEMCVKQFYNDYKSKIYSFMPNSTDSTFKPINYRWEDAQEIIIIGKIVTYVVNI